MEVIYSILEQNLNQAGVLASRESINKCISYVECLCKWNKHMNLVGKLSAYDIVQDLCIDSIHLVSLFQNYLQHAEHIIDCGAGAGIPGVPFRCFYKEATYTMIESREKRVLFIESVLRNIALANTFCKRGRVEEICPHIQIDVVVSRAFMNPYDLCTFMNPFLREGAYIVIMFSQQDLTIPRYRIVHSYSYAVHSGTRYLLLLQKEG